jgi:hypothetical protein
MSSNERRVLLSFDVEEFDLPLEFGGRISEFEQLEVGRRGLEAALELLDTIGVPATLFTTGRLGEHASDLLREASGRHEIASHGVRHDRFEPADFLRSREMLENITGTEVRGFRMARLQPVDAALARSAGYEYDSSENPIRLPGRYDNRHLPRTPRLEDGLLRIPISTTPRLRIPLFWLAFRHLPRAFLRSSLDRTLEWDGHLVLFFHPWELLDLRAYRGAMPRLVRYRGGKTLCTRLEQELGRLRERARFVTMRAFARDRRQALEAEAVPDEPDLDARS